MKKQENNKKKKETKISKVSSKKLEEPKQLKDINVEYTFKTSPIISDELLQKSIASEKDKPKKNIVKNKKTQNIVIQKKQPIDNNVKDPVIEEIKRRALWTWMGASISLVGAIVATVFLILHYTK